MYVDTLLLKRWHLIPFSKGCTLKLPPVVYRAEQEPGRKGNCTMEKPDKL
jgi:hypothetical protein